MLTAGPVCIGPECRGGAPGELRGVGYAGDLDAGSRGAFFQAGRLAGVTAFDGVEVSKGLAAIDQLRAEGTIDGYYAAAAKRAYDETLRAGYERAAPFTEPSPFGMVLAPGAMKQRFRDVRGEEVGPSVREACACTEREPDAIDPVSGWLIYYVENGVLLTPTKKCVAGGGKPFRFLSQTWRNVLALMPSTPVAPPVAQVLPPVELPPAPPGPKPGEPERGLYICQTPVNWWPGWVSYQKTPCEAPMVEVGRT